MLPEIKYSIQFFLSVPAGQNASESTNSYAGRIKSKEMSRMSDETMKERVFLHSRYSRQTDTVEHMKSITHKIMGGLLQEQEEEQEE